MLKDEKGKATESDITTTKEHYLDTPDFYLLNQNIFLSYEEQSSGYYKLRIVKGVHPHGKYTRESIHNTLNQQQAISRLNKELADRLSPTTTTIQFDQLETKTSMLVQRFSFTREDLKIIYEQIEYPD